ncbi:MAG: Na+/H+ antiporter subunit E [Planctomycetota bacterium]|nr:Na+/H+ antiporter subunit E [Planctomycetota bacterium]
MTVPSAAEPTVRQSNQPLRHSVVLFVVLTIVWLSWSGHFEPLLLACGVLSCGLVVAICRRMQIVDAEGAPLRLGLRPLFYVVWLVKEVVEANFHVARRLLDPRLAIHPQLIRLRASQSGDLTRVVYANSITLTPGTVSVAIEDDEIVVHALTRSAADEDKSGEMDRRVTQLEGSHT